MIRSLCILASFLMLVQPGFGQDGRALRGRVFVQTHCAQCHAIGRIGESPLTIAPAFHELHKRYPVDTLAELLAEGIHQLLSYYAGVSA